MVINDLLPGAPFFFWLFSFLAVSVSGRADIWMDCNICFYQCLLHTAFKIKQIDHQHHHHDHLFSLLRGADPS